MGAVFCNLFADLGRPLPANYSLRLAAEFVNRGAAFLAELQDRQFLVVEILRTSGDAEVGNGFQGCVQEKASMALLATDSNHRNQPIP